MSSIVLYPSNWLYNAGVIGLLRVLEKVYEAPTNFISSEGSVTIDLSTALSNQCSIEEQVETFEIPLLALHWLLESWAQLTDRQGSSESEKIKEVWGKLFNTLYRGFFNANTGYLFKPSKSSKALILQLSDFLKSLQQVDESKSSYSCSFCLRSSQFSYKNIFTSEHSKELGASASEKGVPNSFWNLNPDNSLRVCDFCSFVLLNHHLALTTLSDGSEIFINAPSYHVMYYLNKFAREVFGAMSSEEMRNRRTILAMSVIEYVTKVQATLGAWTGMNIEVVNRRGSLIEFFSLPYEVVQLLSDRRIAGLLSHIGEFSILNLALDQNFSRLMEVGYRLLRIGLKPYGERGKSENDFVNRLLRLGKNRRDPARVAQQLFQLCAFIEEQPNRRKAYEHIRYATS